MLDVYILGHVRTGGQKGGWTYIGITILVEVKIQRTKKGCPSFQHNIISCSQQQCSKSYPPVVPWVGKEARAKHGIALLGTLLT